MKCDGPARADGSQLVALTTPGVVLSAALLFVTLLSSLGSCHQVSFAVILCGSSVVIVFPQGRLGLLPWALGDLPHSAYH